MGFAERLEAQARERERAKAERVAQVARDGLERLPPLDDMKALGLPSELLSRIEEAIDGLRELAEGPDDEA